MINWNRSDVRVLTNILVENSMTMGLNAGKVKFSKKLLDIHLVKIFDFILDNYLTSEFTPGNVNFDAGFNSLYCDLKEVKKFNKLQWGMPEAFQNHITSTYGIPAADGKFVEHFLDTGARLYTYLTMAIMNATRRDDYAHKKMHNEIRYARDFVQKLGLSLEFIENIKVLQEKLKVDFMHSRGHVRDYDYAFAKSTRIEV